MGAVFRHLYTRGYSRTTIGAATSISPNRIGALMQGNQHVSTYEVLERVAAGLGIPRGAMGLAYTDDWDYPKQA